MEILITADLRLWSLVQESFLALPRYLLAVASLVMIVRIMV